MIGGGISKKSRRSKYASSYDGKSPEEIQKVKKARDREKAKARMKTPQNCSMTIKTKSSILSFTSLS